MLKNIANIGTDPRRCKTFARRIYSTAEPHEVANDIGTQQAAQSASLPTTSPQHAAAKRLARSAHPRPPPAQTATPLHTRPEQ